MKKIYAGEEPSTSMPVYLERWDGVAGGRNKGSINAPTMSDPVYIFPTIIVCVCMLT